MNSFIPYALLFVSLVAGVPFAQTQMADQPTSKANPAEEEIRRLNVEDLKLSSIRTRRHWRDCGRMISSLPIR
jgi:hypothetical protein